MRTHEPRRTTPPRAATRPRAPSEAAFIRLAPRGRNRRLARRSGRSATRRRRGPPQPASTSSTAAGGALATRRVPPRTAVQPSLGCRYTTTTARSSATRGKQRTKMRRRPVRSSRPDRAGGAFRARRASRVAPLHARSHLPAAAPEASHRERSRTAAGARVTRLLERQAETFSPPLALREAGSGSATAQPRPMTAVRRREAALSTSHMPTREARLPVAGGRR